jgi:hypothetical protein
MLLIGVLGLGFTWLSLIVIACGICASAAQGDRIMLRRAGHRAVRRTSRDPDVPRRVAGLSARG